MFCDFFLFSSIFQEGLQVHPLIGGLGWWFGVVHSEPGGSEPKSSSTLYQGPEIPPLQTSDSLPASSRFLFLAWEKRRRHVSRRKDRNNWSRPKRFMSPSSHVSMAPHMNSSRYPPGAVLVGRRMFNMGLSRTGPPPFPPNALSIVQSLRKFEKEGRPGITLAGKSRRQSRDGRLIATHGPPPCGPLLPLHIAYLVPPSPIFQAFLLRLLLHKKKKERKNGTLQLGPSTNPNRHGSCFFSKGKALLRVSMTGWLARGLTGNLSA